MVLVLWCGDSCAGGVLGWFSCCGVVIVVLVVC